MKNLWSREFQPTEDALTPDEIIDTQCKFLEEATKGKIMAKVSSYAGPISSYISRSPFSNIANALSDKAIDIQEDLGNVSEGDFTFEFFITSLSTPNYKYRVLFLHYEIPFYPAYIVLDDAIAEELGVDHNIVCDNQDNFAHMLELILGSKKMESIISTLLALVQKEESKQRHY